MAKTVDFVVVIEDGVRKRHYHEADGGKIKDFVVQLEVKVRDDWKVVIRYDCAHDFSHVDKYDLNGMQTKEPLGLNFESALTYAEWDINKNWLHYKMEYFKGVSNE